MRVLSKFHGIVIRMFFVRSLAAHFHASYDESELVVGISPVRIINGDGDAPEWVRESVIKWAMAHQRELLSNWELCARARVPLAIEPMHMAVDAGP